VKCHHLSQFLALRMKKAGTPATTVVAYVKAATPRAMTQMPASPGYTEAKAMSAGTTAGAIKRATMTRWRLKAFYKL